MHDFQEHVFTNEFDDLHIAISLNMDAADPSVQVTMSDADRIWDETVLVSKDHAAGGLRTFEGGL